MRSANAAIELLAHGSGNQLARLLSRPSGSREQVAAQCGASGHAPPAARCWYRPRCGRAPNEVPDISGGLSAPRSDGRAAATEGVRSVPAPGRPGWDCTELSESRRSGGDSFDTAATDTPIADGSFDRPSNSTLQPTSGAVTGVRRIDRLTCPGASGCAMVSARSAEQPSGPARG